jgi:hypothetical protein
MGGGRRMLTTMNNAAIAATKARFINSLKAAAAIATMR